MYVTAEMFTLLAITFLIKLKCCQTLHSASSSCSRVGVGRGRGAGALQGYCGRDCKTMSEERRR